TPLYEDYADVVLKKSESVMERYGLRRLCAITEKIIIYYPEANNKQDRRINFYAMATGEFVTEKDIEQEPILKRAKEIVKEYKDWKRFKGHLIFFKNSDCKSYNVIHAPLLISEGEREEVIGVLTIENKLNSEGKVDIQTFSDYEIETFRRWTNIISYCIENKRQKDLFKEIIDSSPHGIIFSDISGDIIEMSTRAKEILNSEKENIKNVRDVYDVENLKKIGVKLKEATEKGEKGVKDWFAELKNQKDKTKIPVIGSAFNIKHFIELPDFPRYGTVGYFGTTGVSKYVRECGIEILDLILRDENVWDKNLHDKIKSFKDEVLKSGTRDNENEYIYSCVEKFFNELCNEDELQIPQELKKLSERFREEERTLRGLPHYREHFLHQFHVFLAGYRIITLLGVEKMVFLINLNRSGIKRKLERNEKFIKFVKGIFQQDDLSYNNLNLCNALKTLNVNVDIENELSQLQYTDLTQEKKNLLKLWFLAAMFHDIAYYYEKLEEWLRKYFSLDYHISWDSFIKDPQYDRFIRDYAKMLSQNEEDRGNISHFFRTEILDNHDHGVISSLLFLKEIPKDTLDRDIYREAALAMALHNFPVWGKLPESLGKRKKINFFDYPIEYLLMYCDFIQEWGRIFHRREKLNYNAKLKDLSLEGEEGEQIACTLWYPKEPDPLDPKDIRPFKDRVKQHLTDIFNSWDCKSIHKSSQKEKPLFKIIHKVEEKFVQQTIFSDWIWND
ncbi:MAG: hypothetical protein AB1410_03615, partial [Acidobacteriota bacterium]